MNTQKNFAYPLVASGFRTFFALAGLSALFLMLVWNAIFKDGAIHANYFSPTVWHAHEMLLGYTVAVIAGFFIDRRQKLDWATHHHRPSLGRACHDLALWAHLAIL